MGTPATLNHDIAERLLRITEDAQRSGNENISEEKIAKIRDYLQRHTRADPRDDRLTIDSTPSTTAPTAKTASRSPLVKSKQSLIYSMYRLPPSKIKPPQLKPTGKGKRQYSSMGNPGKNFVQMEHLVVTILENLANLLDNIHLFSKMPFFPSILKQALKHTNSIWIVVLIFLIKRSISELRRLQSEEREIVKELEIVEKQKQKQTLSQSSLNEDIHTNHHKTLTKIAIQRIMIYVEIGGNILDLTLNVIEFQGWKVHRGFMSVLNICSMLMSVYRVNK